MNSENKTGSNLPKLDMFATHNHSEYSNLRLLDSINRTDKLIDRAIELGLKGIALTDHESLSGHVEFLKHYQKLKKQNPDLDFKIALGNEIYLIDSRAVPEVPSDEKVKFYHFILLAKNANGHRALRELSSVSWYNSYFNRGMERVPTLKDELAAIVKKYPNSLIATTACLGGELPSLVKYLLDREEELLTAPPSDLFLSKRIEMAKQKIIDFVFYMKELFGDDFYIELAPGTSKEQNAFNKKVIPIAEALSVKTIVATDSHYLRKEDSFVHESYLNSQNGEREVRSFYEFCYLMSAEETHELLSKSIGNENSLKCISNTMEILDKIEQYDLFRSPIIPKEKVKFYSKRKIPWDLPSLRAMFDSDSDQNRYWANQCLEGLEKKGLVNDKYLARLDEEADIILHISKNLNEDLSAYFNSFQSYVDIFWECGSIVGPGRGSATGFLSNYLLGITQLDPIKHNLPAFRFLNKDRVELPKQYWAIKRV